MRVPLTALTWLAGFGSGSGCTVLYYQRLKKDETRTTSGKAAGDASRGHPTWNDSARLWTNRPKNVMQSTIAASWPSSKEEVRTLLTHSNKKKVKLRFVGEGTAYNCMAGSPFHMVFTNKLNRILWVDKETDRVRAEAGIRLHDLASQLQQDYGMTLPLLPIGNCSPTLGGALATAAHGTGGWVGAFGDFVESFELITPTGDVLECNATSHPEIFSAGLCHLGALGFVSEVTLRIEPAYKLSCSGRRMSITQVADHLAETVLGHQHVWMDWIPYTDDVIVWECDACHAEVEHSSASVPSRARRQKFSRLLNFFFQPALYISQHSRSLQRFFNSYVSAGVLSRGTTQIVADSAHVFQEADVWPSSNREMYEWTLPLAKLPRALRRLRNLIQRQEGSTWICPAPVRIQFQRGDRAMLSPANETHTVYQSDILENRKQSTSFSDAFDLVMCSIAVPLYRPFGTQPSPAATAWIKKCEEVLYDLGARPSWSNNLSFDSNIYSRLYTHWGRWTTLRNALDPQGILVNAWVATVVNPEYKCELRKREELRGYMVWNQLD